MNTDVDREYRHKAEREEMKYETYAEWGQPSIQESVEPDQPTHNPAEPDNHWQLQHELPSHSMHLNKQAKLQPVSSLLQSSFQLFPPYEEPYLLQGPNEQYSRIFLFCIYLYTN